MRSTASATTRCARRSRATDAPPTSRISRSSATSPATSPSSPTSRARAATGGSRSKPAPPPNRYARGVRFRADRPLQLAPATVLDYRELARRRLPRQLFDYVDGGAYEEGTLRANVAVLGARHRDTRNAVVGHVPLWAKLMRGLDLVSHPRWVRDVAIAGQPLTFGNLEKAVPDARSPAAFRSWVDSQFDPSVTWDDIAWVREHWDGRLVVKGVLDPEDARRAVDTGVDGVIVSNHGGRQLDAVPSTVRALPAVVDAVGGQVEVLVDGGIRTGL